MKKTVIALFLTPALLIFSLFIISSPASAQDALKSPAIPDEVSKIVTASCTPCHTSQGGLMSKTKLNLTEWANYSPEKQKEKAAKMYSELNKGAMPPKGAREKHPELIPTKEQVEAVKKWSESFPADKK
jgi:cytochrome c5